MLTTIRLVGCGRTKRPGAELIAARRLYIGTLTAARIAFAERHTHPGRYRCGQSYGDWYILSAKHGILRPTQLVRPYDLHLGKLRAVDRAAWPIGAAQQLLDELPDGAFPTRYMIEIHAGEQYAEPLRTILLSLGFKVNWWFKGLSQGETKQWYRIRAGFCRDLVHPGVPPEPEPVPR